MNPCIILGFVPGGHAFFTIEQDAAQNGSIGVYDAVTRAKRASIPYPANGPPLDLGTGWPTAFNALWVGDPKREVLAFFPGQGGSDYLELGDLKTGNVFDGARYDNAKFDYLQPVAWTR